MSGHLIQKIVIDPAVEETPLVRRILAEKGNLPVESRAWTSTDWADIPLHLGKRILYVTGRPGGLVKPCPATNPPYLCCRYITIHAMTQCPFDCTYCVLQGYLERPVITLFADPKPIFKEIDALRRAKPGRFFRFGTGELADSLALDDMTGLSEDYLRFFRNRRNALIELKTKSVRIENLPDPAPRNAVISWSVNPQSVIAREELRAPSLADRLDAAKRCRDAGYLIGFHFDPVLLMEDGEARYREVVRQIFSRIDPGRIAWISLGSLRFPAEYRKIMQKRFPHARILDGEMIRGLDGKMRYLRPLRVEMYRKIYGWIRDAAPDVFVYFCMESPAVWNAVTGGHPESNAELDFRFARSLWERFGREIRMDEPRRDAYRAS
ncbi:MAG TPA: hypothetical protein ENN17_05100 [bacterium]|nr:hypothetical protein [bacterium]